MCIRDRHDTDPMEGIADVSTQCTEGDNEYSLGYAEVYKLESFHCSAHWPEVISMVEKIAGQEIMPHPIKLLEFGILNILNTPPQPTKILCIFKVASETLPVGHQ